MSPSSIPDERNLATTTRPRRPPILIGPRRALRRVMSPGMLRMLVGLMQAAILGVLVLVLVGVLVGLLVPVSAAMLTIALNLLGAALAIAGMLVIASAILGWLRR